MDVTREQVLSYRLHVHQIGRVGAHDVVDADVLDLGVQDTGRDGALWALANRGVSIPPKEAWPADLVLVWTLRGAPHVYRRTDLPAVARATRPLSEADAGKRIHDAAKPLRAQGIPVRDALAMVSREMHELVEHPTVKGDVSTALTARLDEPFLRFCRSCSATHPFEMPFRLAALPAGLELAPWTTPPVLRRVTGWSGPADKVPQRLDVIRAYLHLHGPATPAQVSEYLDAPVKDVKAHWPEDAEPVTFEHEHRWILTADLANLRSPPSADRPVRLLSPFDPLLQTRDREVLVPDATQRRQLWVTLGRPGAILHGREIVGLWRPRASGRRLALVVDRWGGVPDRALVDQAERLAASRGLELAGT
jgi:hypothetical protein